MGKMPEAQNFLIPPRINIKMGKNRYLMLDWPVATCMGNSFHLAVAGGVFDGPFSH